MAVDTLHTTRGDHAGEDLSSTRIFGYDKVVLGTFIVSVVALLLPTLLLFRSKIYPFSHRRPTTTTTSSSFTPPSSESHLVVPFIFLRDSTNSSSQKPLEHTLRSAFIGYQRECSNAMTGLSKMLEMALVSESDRNFHNSIGSNKKNNNNNNNNNNGGDAKKTTTTKKKKEEKKQGGVEIQVVVKKLASASASASSYSLLQVRAKRCEVDEDTMIKEMSEEVIIQELTKAIGVWKKKSE